MSKIVILRAQKGSQIRAQAICSVYIALTFKGLTWSDNNEAVLVSNPYWLIRCCENIFAVILFVFKIKCTASLLTNVVYLGCSINIVINYRFIKSQSS